MAEILPENEISGKEIPKDRIEPGELEDHLDIFKFNRSPTEEHPYLFKLNENRLPFAIKLSAVLANVMAPFEDDDKAHYIASINDNVDVEDFNGTTVLKINTDEGIKRYIINEEGLSWEDLDDLVGILIEGAVIAGASTPVGRVVNTIARYPAKLVTKYLPRWLRTSIGVSAYEAGKQKLQEATGGEFDEEAIIGSAILPPILKGSQTLLRRPAKWVGNKLGVLRSKAHSSPQRYADAVKYEQDLGDPDLPARHKIKDTLDFLKKYPYTKSIFNLPKTTDALADKVESEYSGLLFRAQMYPDKDTAMIRTLAPVIKNVPGAEDIITDAIIKQNDRIQDIFDNFAGKIKKTPEGDKKLEEVLKERINSLYSIRSKAAKPLYDKINTKEFNLSGKKVKLIIADRLDWLEGEEFSKIMEMEKLIKSQDLSGFDRKTLLTSLKNAKTQMTDTGKIILKIYKLIPENINIQKLQNITYKLDELAYNPNSSPRLRGTAGRASGEIKKYAGEISPEYKEASRVYREKSKPITELEDTYRIIKPGLSKISFDTAEKELKSLINSPEKLKFLKTQIKEVDPTYWSIFSANRFANAMDEVRTSISDKGVPQYDENLPGKLYSKFFSSAKLVKYWETILDNPEDIKKFRLMKTVTAIASKGRDPNSKTSTRIAGLKSLTDRMTRPNLLLRLLNFLAVVSGLGGSHFMQNFKKFTGSIKDLTEEEKLYTILASQWFDPADKNITDILEAIVNKPNMSQKRLAYLYRRAEQLYISAIDKSTNILTRSMPPKYTDPLKIFTKKYFGGMGINRPIVLGSRQFIGTDDEQYQKELSQLLKSYKEHKTQLESS